MKNPLNMIFENRHHAAEMLFPYLEKYRKNDVVVLAIPRGGVPLGYYIAKHFGWKLNVMLTKKIGHPMNREYAIGAVGLDSIVLNPSHADVTEAYIVNETEHIRNLLKARYIKFAGKREQVDLKNKVVVIVDDGIATGYTMKASIEILRKKLPSKIVVAVPVASPRIVGSLKKMTDDFIVILQPDDFMGVGQFYEDFSEVTDEEVVEFMNETP